MKSDYAGVDTLLEAVVIQCGETVLPLPIADP